MSKLRNAICLSNCKIKCVLFSHYALKWENIKSTLHYKYIPDERRWWTTSSGKFNNLRMPPHPPPRPSQPLRWGGGCGAVAGEVTAKWRVAVTRLGWAGLGWAGVWGQLLIEEVNNLWHGQRAGGSNLGIRINTIQHFTRHVANTIYSSTLHSTHRILNNLNTGHWDATNTQPREWCRVEVSNLRSTHSTQQISTKL